jgi:hypothetical protein
VRFSRYPMSNQISKLLDPRETKHIGLGFVLLGAISILLWQSFGTGYFLVVYGMLFIFIPHKLFPSEEEAKERNETLREKVINARSERIKWCVSPVFLGFVVLVTGVSVYQFI